MAHITGTKREIDELKWDEAFSPHRKKRRRPRLRLKFWKRYVFTDKRHPVQGIFSTALGVLSLVSIAAAILISYRGRGETPFGVAFGVGLCALYTVIGLGMGIYARTRPNIFRFFADTGIILNLLGALAIAGLFYIGVV